ncbi:hypothetical protein WMY93_019576 [Mugilogobius chulae]|uniref:Toll-like receptor 1 n=1 Tax=Mugilogobius chulae TaxID=88201 RepID=A0AAW0NFQ6_9GOBI
MLFGLLLTLDIVSGADLDPNGLRLCFTSISKIQDLSGQNRTAVPLNLPEDTEYLDMSQNPIQELTGEAFSKLHHLCFLKMADCGLTEISPRVFDKIPFLKILNLTLNKLSAIPDLLLPNIQILDLSYNFYRSYQLPKAYKNQKNLELFVLGSANATSVHLSDFDPLQNVTLQHLILGAETKWLTYESGALAKLQHLQEISLKATFCEKMNLLDLILADLNKTQVTAMRFHRSISVQQDSMVFILLEPISVDSLSKRFIGLRSILKQKTYLEWPKEEHKRQVFWASLKAMLHRADKFMVLKEVALAISETTPLINAFEDSKDDTF